MLYQCNGIWFTRHVGFGEFVSQCMMPNAVSVLSRLQDYQLNLEMLLSELFSTI